MEFQHQYRTSSSVATSASRSAISFAPDTLREPTFFVGNLSKKIPFREAISALHDIVISDLRYKPRDRGEYQEWLKRQEEIWLAEAVSHQENVRGQVEEIRGKLNVMEKERSKILAPFYKKQREYFNWLYKKNLDWWYVLDPVITIHPDELFFECFSQDESTYGKLSCNYNVFEKINEFSCGTTNIDYSDRLYNEFQKIRDYKNTEFSVDPGGFDLKTTGEDEYKEKKIDVPDSWVRGFLQVSSAMTLPGHVFYLHPLDIYNICVALRRKKEKKGPRSLRYLLKEGQPVRVRIDPWNDEIICHRSIYNGPGDQEIRVWGRRRLLTLERLIPLARSFKVVLLGSGMPSFYLADLGDMTFTLGLSGWTANDWSRMGNFDLMAPRSTVDATTCETVFKALKENWKEEADSLSKRLNMDSSDVTGALSLYAQSGRVIYDLSSGVYRVRELTQDPLPLEAFRFANERENSATRFLEEGAVVKVKAQSKEETLKLSGCVKLDKKQFNPVLVIDSDDRIIEGSCSCNFYFQNKLRRGPCEHMIALRLAHSSSQQIK